jgi:hypothetical protein
MHDVMRKRLWRKLEALPDDQIYQVLDYIEFLEARYARQAQAPADGLQRLAERLEDRLRARSLAPAAIGGTMRLIGTAGRVLDGITEAGRELTDAGRELFEPPARSVAGGPAAAAGVPAPRRVDAPGAAAGEDPPVQGG